MRASFQAEGKYKFLMQVLMTSVSGDPRKSATILIMFAGKLSGPVERSDRMFRNSWMTSLRVTVLSSEMEQSPRLGGMGVNGLTHNNQNKRIKYPLPGVKDKG